MNEPECWKQTRVEHCPDPHCKGMLLQNDYQHHEKCSECGKKFMQRTIYVEIMD